MAEDVYSDEYKKRRFEALWGPMEAKIRQLYSGRGARFGNMQQQLADQQTKIASGIAQEAEDARIKQDSEERAFQRNQQEQIRREHASQAMEAARRQANWSQNMNYRNLKEFEDARKLKEARTYQEGRDKQNYDYLKELKWGPNSQYGEIVDLDEEEKRKRAGSGYPNDIAGTSYGGGGPILQRPQRFAPVYEPFNLPNIHQDILGTEEIGGPGDINERTLNEFQRTYDDYEDTTDQLYDQTLGEIPGLGSDTAQDVITGILNPQDIVVDQIFSDGGLFDFGGGSSGGKYPQELNPDIMGYNPRSGQTRYKDGTVRDQNGNVIRQENERPSAAPMSNQEYRSTVSQAALPFMANRRFLANTDIAKRKSQGMMKYA